MNDSAGPVVENARIEIWSHLTRDGDIVVNMTREGDAQQAVTALGLLAMCQDTVLHEPDDQEQP